MKARKMALTPDLVGLVHRTLEDPGPEPGLVYHTSEDYDAIIDRMLASHPPEQDAWLFAYGSLIWKPEVEHVEARRGTAHGWHRSFCFRISRWRASREQPGLMMAMDRGGQCEGMLYRLPGSSLREQMGKLFRREFTVKPANSMPRWIKVATGEEPVVAMAFVMNRQSPAYVGRLAPEEVADALAKACGHWGSCAEYLHNTVLHLEQKGIHDRHLWQLQKLVAARIAHVRTGQA